MAKKLVRKALEMLRKLATQEQEDEEEVSHSRVVFLRTALVSVSHRYQ